MQKLFTTLLLMVSLTTFGQREKIKPFKLIVLKPDKAIIDQTLYSEIDSIQVDYLKRYYSSIKQMEEFISSKNFPNDTSFKASQDKVKPNFLQQEQLSLK